MMFPHCARHYVETIFQPTFDGSEHLFIMAICASLPEAFDHVCKGALELYGEATLLLTHSTNQHSTERYDHYYGYQHGDKIIAVIDVNIREFVLSTLYCACFYGNNLPHGVPIDKELYIACVRKLIINKAKVAELTR